MDLEERYGELLSGGPMSLRARRWVALCAAAEAVGMTAAAFAARTSEGWSTPPALTLVVLGGLVEGLALGTLQGRGLTAWLPSLNRRRFLIATVLVAGLGWAAASAPAVTSSDDQSAADPALALVLLGAAGIGLVMGPLLGAAQAATMRGVARHPWRWVTASTVAWIPTMVLIFIGATTASGDWSTGVVTLWGTVTGLCAGAVLGLLTLPFLVTLDGPPLHNVTVMAALRSPRLHVFEDSLVVLTVRGRRTGRIFELPAQYATDGTDVVVLPGHAEGKRWWRNLEIPSEVTVWHHGGPRTGTGRVLHPGDDAYDRALSTYRERWPRAVAPTDQPLVVVDLRASELSR